MQQRDEACECCSPYARETFRSHRPVSIKKFFRGDPGLLDRTSKGSDREIGVQRDNTTAGTATKNHVAAALPDLLEPEVSKDPNRLLSGKARTLGY